MKLNKIVLGCILSTVCGIAYFSASVNSNRLAVGERKQDVAKPLGVSNVASGPSSPVPDFQTPAPPEVSASPSELTAGDRIAELSSSSRPTERMEAYMLADKCWARRLIEQQNNAKVQAERRDISEVLGQFVGACDGVTSEQLRARYDNLKIAAAANVPGSAAEFVYAGPFGDPSALSQRPDDPLVTEWKNQSMQYLKSAADAGDRSAVSVLVQAYDNGILTAPDKTQSLAYYILNQKIAAQNGVPVNSAYLQKLEHRLGPEQVSAATADAQTLFDKCCAH